MPSAYSKSPAAAQETGQRDSSRLLASRATPLRRRRRRSCSPVGEDARQRATLRVAWRGLAQQILAIRWLLLLGVGGGRTSALRALRSVWSTALKQREALPPSAAPLIMGEHEFVSLRSFQGFSTLLIPVLRHFPKGRMIPPPMTGDGSECSPLGGAPPKAVRGPTITRTSDSMGRFSKSVQCEFARSPPRLPRATRSVAGACRPPPTPSVFGVRAVNV